MGLEATKYLPVVAPMDAPLNKSFVFLFNGGLLPRKGIDILLEVSDEVSCDGAPQHCQALAASDSLCNLE